MERLTAVDGMGGPHAPRVVLYGLEELTPAERERWWGPLRFWPFALIGDSGWEIEVKLVRELEKRGDVTILPNDRKATITLWIDNAEAERSLVHELVHILLCPLETVGGRPLDHMREMSCEIQTKALCACTEESAVRLAAAILVVRRFERGT